MREGAGGYKLGFDVNEQLNLNVVQFRRVLREFARRVQDDDAIAVLYYAGHGLQIDGNSENPVS